MFFVKLKAVWSERRLLAILTRHSYAVDVYGTSCRLFVRL